MDIINKRLESGNSITISQIISKLVENIRTEQDTLESNEFKFLKEKCFSLNHSISTTAIQGVLSLCTEENFRKLLSDFCAIITTTRCPNNIVFLINKLLLFQTGIVFNLRVPQHPLIVLLNDDGSSGKAIFKEISHSYHYLKTQKSLDELYKPVFLYVLCNPNQNFGMFSLQLWTLLLDKSSSAIVESLLSWMLFESGNQIETNSDFLLQLVEINARKQHINSNLLFLLQIANLYRLLMENLDPRLLIYATIETVVAEKIVPSSEVQASILLLIKCVKVTPSQYLADILELCKIIIVKHNVHIIVREALKAAVFHWMANTSSLTLPGIEIANEILALPISKSNQTSSFCLEFIKKYKYFIETSSEVNIALRLITILERFDSKEDVLNWMQDLRNVPFSFLLNIWDFLNGLFICDFGDDNINLNLFEVLFKCVDFNRELAASFLTVLLYKLTNVKNSKLHYKILKALPKMAVYKENTSKIVNIITAMGKSGATLRSFSMNLMLDLWRGDNKCYNYLECMLVLEVGSVGQNWEFYATKANILKELCTSRPELYGKDLLAHLSKILNDCSSPQGALPSAIAIDAITSLCKAEVIDAVTTWETLLPVFTSEVRIPVMQSICRFISEIPSLSYIDAYPKLMDDSLVKLWNYIHCNEDIEIVSSALNALTSFPVDSILAQVPNHFLNEELIEMKDRGVLLPGIAWVEVLKNCSRSILKSIGDFLIKMVALEVSSYLEFIYHVKGTREPDGYSNLPSNSIVRGLSIQIKSKVVQWKYSVDKEVYLECLRIFSQGYSKPLPPLDWCFLQELVHEPEAKDYCIKIAVHQVVLSGTARRFVVNYIEAALSHTSTKEDTLQIYSNLVYLANSVQPFTLQPFFNRTILEAVNEFNSGNEDYLNSILDSIASILPNKNIQEANKATIVEILCEFIKELDSTSPLFLALLKVVILFPESYINELSDLKETTPGTVEKAVQIRCLCAKNTTKAPLNWLNPLIDITGNHPKLLRSFLSQISQVFQVHKDSSECTLWILELLGKIQSMIVDKSTNVEILYHCNIFMFATVVFSGHFIFERNYLDFNVVHDLFPAAIARLLDVNHWSICTNQVLEWFHHMHSERILHDEFGNLFIQCLKALRHEEEFQKNLRWTRYLNTELDK